MTTDTIDAHAPGRTTRRPPRPSLTVGLLAGLLALAGLAELHRLGEATPALDFYAAWAVAQNVGRSDLPSPYDPAFPARITAEMRQRIELAGRPPRLAAAFEANRPLQVTSTPFLLTAVAPFSRGTYEDDHRRFQRASRLLGIGGLLVLLHLGGAGGPAALLWLAVAAFTFDPLLSDVRVGNVQQLLVGALAVSLGLLHVARSRSGRWARGAVFGAGAALGLAIAFKPLLLLVPAVLVAARVLDGRGRDALLLATGSASGLAMGVLTASLRLGSGDAWWRWFGALRTQPLELTRPRIGNVSPARWLADLLRVDVFACGVLLALALGALLAAAILRRRRGPARRTGRDDLLLACLGVALILTSAPLVWVHYLLLTLPAFPLLLDDVSRFHPLRTLLTVVCFACLALRPLADLGIPTAPPVPQLALLLLFGLLLDRFRAQDAGPSRATAGNAPVGDTA